MGKNIMVFVTGQEFASSGPILNILVLAIVAIFFGTMFTYLLVAMNLQKAMIKYYLLAAIFGLVGYFVFIPRYSYWAAAMITVLVEVFIWLGAFYLVRRNVQTKISLGVLGRCFLAGVLSFLLFWPWRDWSVLVLGLLSSGFYFILLFVFRAIDKEELKIILNK